MTKLAQKEGLLTTLLGLSNVAFYGSFVLALQQPATTPGWYVVVVLGLMSLSLLMINLALIQHRAMRWLACFLPALAAAGFGQLQPAAIAGAGLLAIATLIAAVIVRDQLDDYVRFHVRAIFWGPTKLVIVGTLAALAGLCFPRLVAELQHGSFQLSERAVAPLVKPLTPIVENLIPGYQSDQPLSQLIDHRVLEQLPLPLQQELSHQHTASQQAPTLVGLITSWLNQHISKFAAESPTVVSLVILVSIFFTLWLLSPAVVWPTIGSILGLLWLFRRLHLARLESHPEPVEHLTLS